jgi:hypothetical protein
MPEGKQLSFQYGEVSPSTRYRSDAPFRNSALYKARNGTVMKEGGFANRSGFKNICEIFPALNATGQYVPKQNEDQICKLLPIQDSSNGSTKVLAYVGKGNDITGVSAHTSCLIYSQFGDAETLTVSAASLFAVRQGDARKTSITNWDNNYLVTLGEASNGQGSPLYFTRETSPSLDWQVDPLLGDISGTPYPTITKASNGLTPTDIPCAYIITKVLEDGSELIHAIQEFADFHPHAQLQTKLSFSHDSTRDIRVYRIYRAAGKISSSFGLVGVVKPLDDATATYEFGDFVTTSDILNGPPIIADLYATDPESTISGAGMSGEIGVEYRLENIRRSMIYQQRMYCITDRQKSGEVIASKIGTPKFFFTTAVIDAINAFSLEIPNSAGSPYFWSLPLRQPLFFSRNYVYMMRGGESGLVTATEINPDIVSRTGCSDRVEPVYQDNVAYYVDSTESRIIAVAQSEDGRSSETRELSQLFDHTFDRDKIVQLCVTSGVETILWIVTRSGKLCAITMSDVAGFSLIEVEGKVESVCAIKAEVPFTEYGFFGDLFTDAGNTFPDLFIPSYPAQETIAASIIRDGYRYLEILTPRNDLDEEGFAFCDSYKNFGSRLVRTQTGKYAVLAEPYGRQAQVSSGDPDSTLENTALSINKTLGTNYLAGETCSLYAQIDLSTTIGVATYVDFYYEDSDGYKRTLRFTRTGSPVWNGGTSIFYVQGFFSEDVPSILQNVLNAPTYSISSDYDNNAFTTRYSIPINQVTGLTHLANKDVSVFADNEVISSPLNPSDTFTTLTVSGAGVLDLPDYFGYGVVGLPYTFEMETLPLEPADNRSLTSENKIINEAGIAFDRTRGGYASDQSSADDISKMEPIIFRENEDFDAPSENFSGHVDVNFSGSYDRDSRVKIKQVDPLPMTVLSVYPKGVSGG